MEETKDKTLEEINLLFSPAAASSILRAQEIGGGEDEKDLVSKQVEVTQLEG